MLKPQKSSWKLSKAVKTCRNHSKQVETRPDLSTMGAIYSKPVQAGPNQCKTDANELIPIKTCPNLCKICGNLSKLFRTSLKPFQTS